MTGLDGINQADYMAPALGNDGQWSCIGAILLRKDLGDGRLQDAVQLLEAMEREALVAALHGAGFPPAPENLGWTVAKLVREAMPDLEVAASMGMDGFSLSSLRDFPRSASFAAKESKQSVSSAIVTDPNLPASAFIQSILRQPSISVDLAGSAGPENRPALLLVASQALSSVVQGFSFDGIAGKYAVPLSMAKVVNLHAVAAASVAEESARFALGEWVAGKPISDLSEWVPDSIQRLLHGSVALDAASVVVEAIEGGSIATHAANIGSHKFAYLLKQQGFDVEAPTVSEQAAELSLQPVTPDRERGQYVGKVVALDHRAGLVKFNRTGVIEVPFDALSSEQCRPVMGDTLRLSYKNGELSVAVAGKLDRVGSER